MNIEILPVKVKRGAYTTDESVWALFAPHHYLTEKYAGHGAFLAVLEDGSPVAFTSYIASPSGHYKNGYREHRTVVLPDFQGLGLGARLGDWLGGWIVSVKTEGRGRFYSRTMHPRLAAYRDRSPLWVPTAGNLAQNKPSEARPKGTWGNHDHRKAFSHRYIGAGLGEGAA